MTTLITKPAQGPHHTEFRILCIPLLLVGGIAMEAKPLIKQDPGTERGTDKPLDLPMLRARKKLLWGYLFGRKCG